MAEAISNALAEERGLPWRAESAGVAALVGEGVSPRARAALEELGVFSEDHRARQVNARMLEGADLVLAMTRDHAETLRRLSPGAPEKVRTLVAFADGTPEGGDIPDPHGQPMFAHRASARQIFRYLDAAMGRLATGGGRPGAPV